MDCELSFRESQQTKKHKVTSVEELYSLLKRQYALLQKVDSLPPDECSLCASSKLDVVKVSISPFSSHLLIFLRQERHAG